LVFAVDKEFFPLQTVADGVFVVAFQFLNLFEKFSAVGVVRLRNFGDF
jgi:hypothetical protein